MKKFKLLSFLLIITLFAGLLPTSALAEGEPQISAQMAVLMNADTGEVLYQREGDTATDPNVLGQLMTMLLIGDGISTQSIALTDTVTASDTFAIGLESANVLTSPAITPGEVMTVEQLLYLLAIPGNMDAANVLAEYDYGSVSAFVDAMNARAAELGCTNTHFVNPTGISVDGQYSSAHDLALITSELLKVPALSTILQSTSYTVPATQFADVRQITNSNPLLIPEDPLYYKDAYSGKTGGGSALGRHFMAAASYNGLDAVAIILGSPDDTTRAQDAISLFNWAFSTYGFRTLLSSTDTLGTVPVDLGDPSSVSVRAENQIQRILPLNQDLSDLRYEIVYLSEQTGEPLQAPVEVGQYVGDVTVYLNGENYGTSRVLASTSSDISRMEYLRTQLDTLIHTDSVRQLVTVLLVILAVYILLVVFYRIQRFLHLRSLRRARRDRAISRANQEIEWLDIPEDENGVPVASLPEQDDSQEEEPPDSEPDGEAEGYDDEAEGYDDGAEGYDDGAEGYDDGAEGFDDEQFDDDDFWDGEDDDDLYDENGQDPNTFDGPYKK